MVDASEYLNLTEEELEAAGINELVYYPVLTQILEKGLEGDELMAELRANNAELIPKHIMKEDILGSINYCLNLEYGIGQDDDIDHLGNRRIRAVGELLQNQYRIGMSRMERVVRERMSTNDPSDLTPQSLINIKPVTAAVKEFFGSSQLSQFMDQNNPLADDVCRSMPEHLHGFRRYRKSHGWYKEFPGAAGESYSDCGHQQECCPRQSGETELYLLKGCFLPVAEILHRSMQESEIEIRSR